MAADVTQVAAWLASLELAGTMVFAAAAVVEALLGGRCAATRRGVWALAIVVGLALALTRLVLAAPAWRPSVGVSIALLTVWGIGAVVLLARLGRGLVRARALRDRGVVIDAGAWWDDLRALGGSAVELRVSDAVVTPLAVGVRRPAILVPRGMLGAPAAERRAVLAHELAHVDRADCLLLLAGAVVRAIYWVSPLAWWGLRRLRARAEEAADDAALRTGIRSSSYAAQLLALARSSLERAGRVAADGLRGRVRGILDARRIRSRTPRWSVARLAGAAVLLATLVTACEARSGEADGGTIGLHEP